MGKQKKNNRISINLTKECAQAYQQAADQVQLRPSKMEVMRSMLVQLQQYLTPQELAKVSGGGLIEYITKKQISEKMGQPIDF